MTSSSKLCLIALFTCCLAAEAKAQEAAYGTPTSAAAGVRAPLVHGPGFFTTVAANALENPLIMGSLTLDPGLIIGLGIGLSKNTAATPLLGTPVNEPSTWGVTGMLDLEYMVINQLPVAMGPMVMVIANLGPDAFNVWQLAPGWSMWVAPWSAPVAIGLSWAATWTFIKSANANVESVTRFQLGSGMLRFSYFFG